MVLLGRLFLLCEGRAFGWLAGPFRLTLVLAGRRLGDLGRAGLVGIWGFGAGIRCPGTSRGRVEIVASHAARAVTALAVLALGARGIGVVALRRAGRAALAGRRAGAAFAGPVDSRDGDAALTRTVLFDRLGEGIGLLRGDF